VTQIAILILDTLLYSIKSRIIINEVSKITRSLFSLGKLAELIV